MGVLSPASPKPEVLLVKMKLSVTVLSLLLVGTALATPFDDHCAACCINTPTPAPTTTTTIASTTTVGSATTTAGSATTTAGSPTTTASTTTTTASTTSATDAPQNDEAKESTTTPALQTCDQIFEEGCKCDTDGAAHHIVSLAVLASLVLIALIF